MVLSPEKMGVQRREFLKTAALAFAGLETATSPALAKDPSALHKELGTELRESITKSINDLNSKTNVLENANGAPQFLTESEANDAQQAIFKLVKSVAQKEGQEITLLGNGNDLAAVNEYLKGHNLRVLPMMLQRRGDPDHKLPLIEVQEIEPVAFRKMVGDKLPEIFNKCIDGKDPEVWQVTSRLGKKVGANYMPALAATTIVTPGKAPFIIYDPGSVSGIVNTYQKLGFKISKDDVRLSVLANESAHVDFARKFPALKAESSHAIEIQGKKESVTASEISEAYSDYISISLGNNISAAELFRVYVSSQRLGGYNLTGSILKAAIDKFEKKQPSTLNFAFMQRDPASFFSSLSESGDAKLFSDLHNCVLEVYKETLDPFMGKVTPK